MLGTDTGPSYPHWGEKEQTMSVFVPLMTWIALSQNPWILTPKGNAASHVRDDGNGNMSSVLTDWKPWSGLGPDSRDPVPEILVG